MPHTVRTAILCIKKTKLPKNPNQASGDAWAKEDIKTGHAAIVMEPTQDDWKSFLNAQNAIYRT